MRRALAFAIAALACCALGGLAGCGDAAGDSQQAGDGAAAVVTDDGAAATASAAEEFGNLIMFEGLTLDGEPISQDAFAQADVTIVNFWATFCGPCVAEMPELAEFAEQLPGNVQFLTACLDVSSAGEDAARQILADAGYDGITIMGGGGDFESLVQHIQYIPTTIAFDSEGRALSAFVGSPEDVTAAYTDFMHGALEAVDASAGA